MKKTILLLLFYFSLYCSYSQETQYSYCQIVGYGFFGKIKVQVDYGEEIKYWKDSRINDEAGKAIKFNSMIDALNYMALQGWEHVQAYAISTGGSNVYHHLLKRPVNYKAKTATE
jgi:hypothetical protein